MQNQLVMNAEGPEIRVAVVEEGALAEFFVERKRERGIVGNIYRGKVTRVLPGMQAAFVDLGSKVERAAFLYVADVLGSGDERKLFEDVETRRRRRIARRRGVAHRAIAQAARGAQDRGPAQARAGRRSCQVAKEPIGTKGARVTGYVSLPGRNLRVHAARRRTSASRGASAPTRSARGCAIIVNECAPEGHRLHRAHRRRGRDRRRSCATTSTSSSSCGARSPRGGHEARRRPRSTPISISLLRTVRDLFTREDTSEVMIDDRRASTSA